jgi:hypothetical protein
MAESSTTEAPGTDSTGAEIETQGQITNLEELTASFVEKVEESENPREESEAKEAETSQADAESDEKDVLLQFETEEESEEESEEVVEEEEEEAEEAEAEPPKAVGKLLKQVSRLTKRAKTSEEQAEALKAEIDALKANPQSTTAEPQKPALEEVNTYEELESLRKEALAAKRWSLQHIGKDFVESGGKEYSDDDIRGILTQAEDYLSEKIPERAQHLQSQAQWAKDTLATHPWIKKSEGFEDRKEIFEQIKGQYSQVLGSLPNADFVAATLARGVEAIQADHAKAGKAPAKKRRAKPPPSEIGDSSPPVQTAATRQTVEKAKILERRTLSENDLAAFLAD